MVAVVVWKLVAMASEAQQAKAEAIRDYAAKGNLEESDKMVKENLEDVIWWINEGSSRGNTALQLAAMWGHVDCCQALLAAGADKDKQSNVSERRYPLRTHAQFSATQYA